jgi:hypothetical protein
MVNPGEGYRLLQRGEVIEYGDEYRAHAYISTQTGQPVDVWQPTGDAGEIHTGRLPRRRKIANECIL